MKFKLRKIDAIIIVALIIIAGIVLLRAGYIPEPGKEKPPIFNFIKDDENYKLIVEYVSTDVLWSDIEITGNCDKSGLSEYVHPGDEITNCRETIILNYLPTNSILGSWTFKRKEKLPESIIPSNERSVSPEDEGVHYNKLFVSREWWYYSVIFSDNSELAGWVVSISFNHMARNDLFWLKPDILVVGSPGNPVISTPERGDPSKVTVPEIR